MHNAGHRASVGLLEAVETLKGSHLCADALVGGWSHPARAGGLHLREQHRRVLRVVLRAAIVARHAETLFIRQDDIGVGSAA